MHQHVRARGVSFDDALPPSRSSTAEKSSYSLGFFVWYLGASRVPRDSFFFFSDCFLFNGINECFKV